MLFGPLAQPRPQSGVRVTQRLAGPAVTLGGAVLRGDPAGEPLTDLHHPHKMMHGGSPALRAQKFPRAISLSAAFSSSASANSRLSVAFSRSRSLSRLTSSAFRPPN